MTASTRRRKAVHNVSHVVLAHGISLLVDGGLQILEIAIAASAGLGFHLPPDTVIQRVEIWTLRRPEVLGLELVPHLAGRRTRSFPTSS
ncbi:Uncharacterized protein FKW44_004516 [Caligus rogercresseyi]|uniref:Uncharacterized protein n=1 Tax=Caligus rogercresseyi TaxID=217165 RepID=A0A7T8KB23_CALRO|nr:Uncharacterized protein FKW44_004516 [Caligus rogercresseyi]